ncbi:MAG: hypothetical protein Q8T09_08640 [Candidatus Melainabacteria bacterium]|nr:hypothetical protein [Candidatus Melainabacteria bacterium]
MTRMKKERKLKSLSKYSDLVTYETSNRSVTVDVRATMIQFVRINTG